MPHAEMVPVNEVIVSNGSFIGRETGEKGLLWDLKSPKVALSRLKSP